MKQIIILGFVVVLAAFFAFLFWHQQAAAPVAVDEYAPSATTTESPDTNPTVPADIQAAIDAKSDLIVVAEPAPGSSVTSPVTVRGQARGQWYFEGSFPLVVVDWDGKIIGQGYATASSEWMTTEFVPFVGTIEYVKELGVYSDAGAIIFRKDNPSGLPEHDDALELPVILN